MDSHGTDALSSYVAAEHARRAFGQRRLPDEKELRSAVRTWRDALQRAMDGVASDRVRVADGLTARRRIVQSQRSVSADALLDAVKRVTADDVRQHLARAAATSVACDEDEAWWRCVVALTRDQAIRPTRTVSVVTEDGDGAGEASPEVLAAANGLREAQRLLAQHLGETKLMDVPSPDDGAALRALEQSGAAGVRVVVSTTDGAAHTYNVRYVAGRRSSVTPTPALLSRAATVEVLRPEIARLRRGAATHEAAVALLDAAKKGLGKERPPTVQLRAIKRR